MTDMKVATETRCWPVAPLIDRVGNGRDLALIVWPKGGWVSPRRMLTEETADRWAVAAGYHPVEVWGSAWYEQRSSCTCGRRGCDERVIR